MIIDDQSGDLYLLLSHAISELIMFLQLYIWATVNAFCYPSILSIIEKKKNTKRQEKKLKVIIKKRKEIQFWSLPLIFLIFKGLFLFCRLFHFASPFLHYTITINFLKIYLFVAPTSLVPGSIQVLYPISTSSLKTKPNFIIFLWGTKSLISSSLKLSKSRKKKP